MGCGVIRATGSIQLVFSWQGTPDDALLFSLVGVMMGHLEDDRGTPQLRSGLLIH